MSALQPLFLDLGPLGDLVTPRGPLEQWQDHGLGLLRTILWRAGIATSVASTRACRVWAELDRPFRRANRLMMNVRSYNFRLAAEAARRFHRVQPEGLVLVGGLHATVDPASMRADAAFDRICAGPGEGIIADLVREPGQFPRFFLGQGARTMAEWPAIERTLWPKPRGWRARRRFPWPLEPACGWGPAPVATILTSRTCPWSCAFCNEASYLPHTGRRPAESVLAELNDLDQRHGPIGSVVLHDSLFFQQPSWLNQWRECYPRLARRIWPYWAAARSDLIRRWPELFKQLVRETRWDVISLGLESGSDRMLRLLNKEHGAADNLFAIDLINRLGDELEAEHRPAPRVWANIMLGIPGETRQDAFQTMSMVRRIKRGLLSPSFFTAYPGSVLGYQLIAEGKSLLSAEEYQRYPREEKIAGVDYGFYRGLLAGRYNSEIEQVKWPDAPAPTARAPTCFFLFATRDPRGVLAYGGDPKDALEILSLRLTPEEMGAVQKDRWRAVSRDELVRIGLRGLGAGLLQPTPR